MASGIAQRTVVRYIANPEVGNIVVVGQAEYVALERRTGKVIGDVLQGRLDADGWAYMAFRAVHRGSADDTRYDEWLASVASVLPEEQEQSIADQADVEAAATTWWRSLPIHARAEQIAERPAASVAERWEAAGNVIAPNQGQTPEPVSSPSSPDLLTPQA
jgi:hypothetical protein